VLFHGFFYTGHTYERHVFFGGDYFRCLVFDLLDFRRSFFRASCHPSFWKRPQAPFQLSFQLVGCRSRHCFGMVRDPVFRADDYRVSCISRESGAGDYGDFRMWIRRGRRGVHHRDPCDRLGWAHYYVYLKN